MEKSPQQVEFALKETTPNIGAGDKLACAYDLVEQMQYLYVKVLKARDLPPKDLTGSCDPYVEVKLGNYKGITKHLEKKTNPEWNQCFAFSKERIQASVLEVVVKDKDYVVDEVIGRVAFDVNEIPKRVPPDSPLAPQWYRLEDRSSGEKLKKGEVMVAVWMGTQADESFPDAWHSDAATVGPEGISWIRSKVYLAPRLWYVRVNVIEAQDLEIPSGKKVETVVKATLGAQALKTRPSPGGKWNEDLLFVVADPLEEPILLSVEGGGEVLGKCVVGLQGVQRRLDHKPVHTKWFNLERYVKAETAAEALKKRFSSRLHLRVCLEGGYHVMDESTLYSSDLKPSARQLWRPSIGILELGVISAAGLAKPSDAFCVAKYGQKWVRTRTIVATTAPKWNEQYTWEVYDPCTVLTVGVFTNGAASGNDARIGKVRIRLSTLETDRVYTHSYPLLLLQSSGVKKAGEVQLAMRFTCSSFINMLHVYSHPLLPKMHYIHPIGLVALDALRHHAMRTVAARLARAEPPLRREVVEYMLDADSHVWSMRRSKANFFRLMAVTAPALSAIKWFHNITHWTNPFTTVLIHILFAILVLYPELLLPTALLYVFVVGVWNFRRRPRHPPHMDIRLSHAHAAHPDELDEEFDTFPTTKPGDTVRMRYDRLRTIAGRVQTVVGDVATQGERLHSLISWRDPRATALFLTLCLIGAVVLYVTPFQVLCLLTGIYTLRHPRFRHKLPTVPLNFFRRLPSRSDTML